MFFVARPIKEARHVAKAARKLLAYRRDLLPEPALAEMRRDVEGLEEAIHARDRAEITRRREQVEAIFGRHIPPHKDAGLRENCEVFLVAIVIALAVRSYFLQPFTIPTGSMQPTLNGIIGHPTEEPPPNVLVQAGAWAVFGRNYVNEVSEVDDVITGVRERKFLNFFTVTDIQMQKQKFTVWMSAKTLTEHFLPGLIDRRTGQMREMVFPAGTPVVRGYVNTGDHVFVDKLSLNFRMPRRGEVFVFKTNGLQTVENRMNPGSPSQFYIKRLVGLPGDVMRIDPPYLYVNGEVAKEVALQRVMSREDGYHGYSSGPGTPEEPFGPGIGRPFSFLGYPDETVQVPPKHYLALGDNSYQSSDGRDWGFVPERNVMGVGLLVYWPFTRHWGLIR